LSASHLTVIYDACVLYPAPLRSLLMYLAMTDLFRARWTEAIHAEWMRNVQKDYSDITREQVERIRDLMNTHVRDCLVTGYEALIPSLTLPDPDDRHVLAAAIRAGARVIVTANLSDFPVDLLEKYGIEAQHPDEFVMRLLDSAADIVCSAARQQRESLKRPPKTVDEYLESLERQGLPRTVASLRPFSEFI
jgi:predicted nucleic acid-binding protein